MCNVLFQQSVLPTNSNRAIIRPLLKKLLQEPNDLNSYRVPTHLKSGLSVKEQHADSHGPVADSSLDRENKLSLHEWTRHWSDSYRSTKASCWLPSLFCLNKGNFVVHRTCLKLRERTFSVVAPQARYQLPTELKTLRSAPLFKRNFKTFLFRVAYNV